MIAVPAKNRGFVVVHTLLLHFIFHTYLQSIMNMEHFNDNQVVTQTNTESQNFKKPKTISEMTPKIPLSRNNPELSTPFRPKVCLLFQSGRCHYGENCRYFHTLLTNDVRKSGFKGHLNENRTKSDQMDSGEYCDDKVMFYKTRLCSKWEKYGTCYYGLKCYYAHGNAELKKPAGSIASKWKVVESESNRTKTAKKKLEVEGKKECFKKWNVEKVGRIYGDWI
ncbi:hypothetical protein ACJIZ3_020340 [Penstemon smallii]|uniref:C3H1-type domain-containing protein n=1 Tax=Penstemon smallii TaxID=265156 RepID=A0ABD3SIU6_9LAMI